MLFKYQQFLRDKLHNTKTADAAKSAFLCIRGIEEHDPAAQFLGFGIAFRMACYRHGFDPRQILEIVDRMITTGLQQGNQHIWALDHYCGTDIGPTVAEAFMRYRRENPKDE